MAENRIKNKWRKIFRWILWIVVIQFILINISAALYAYRLTHFYNEPLLSQQDQKRNILSKTWRLFRGPKYSKAQIKTFPEFNYETINLKTKDGTAIEAWYSKTDSLAAGTVILFHGVGGGKNHLLNEATAFRNIGYNVMMVDFRGFGNSGGNTTTLSIREVEEVKLSFDYINQLGEKRIFLWGGSMGAVTVAKAISDYHLKVSGIMLESPFASIQSHLEARARLLGFPSQPFAFLTTCWIGVERGFNGLGAKTCKYAKNIQCPVLVQWGSRDDYVLKWEINAVFDAIASPDKKLIVYKDAFHESLVTRDAALWYKEVKTFLSNN